LASVEFREQLKKAGIDETKPLHAVLVTVMDAAREAKDAKVLSSRAEQDLAQRVAQLAVSAVQRQVHRLTWRSRITALLRGMVIGAALLGTGYGVAKWEMAGFQVPSSVLR
jgi:hypothetical protein